MENETAKIQPFVYEDELTGKRVEVRVSSHFSTLHIDQRVYYFVKETGEFDGTSAPMRDRKDD